MVKRNKKINILKRDLVFQIVLSLFLVLFGIITLYPIWHIIISAFSDPVKLSSGQPLFLPKGFSTEIFVNNLKNIEIWNAYGVTFFITIVGTIVSIIITILGAFVISDRGLPGRKILTVIVMLPIWLKPGTIAIFQNMVNLGIDGSILGIIFPFALSSFNIILLRTSFLQIPIDLIEAAEIDGANRFQLLTKVFIPNSIPAITMVSIFHLIDRWNGYFWSGLVLKQDTYPMQVFVKSYLTERNIEGIDPTISMVNAYSLILIALIPMLLIFPFIQKRFKKGIMAGSVK